MGAENSGQSAPVSCLRLNVSCSTVSHSASLSRNVSPPVIGGTGFFQRLPNNHNALVNHKFNAYKKSKERYYSVELAQLTQIISIF